MTSPSNPSSPPSSTIPNAKSTAVTTPILLLKTPSPSASTDAYTRALIDTPYNFEPHYVPILSHTLLPDPLIQLLVTHLSPSSPSTDPTTSDSARDSPTKKQFPYGALILTSQRAVAALRTALLAPPVQKNSALLQNLRSLKLRIYTVGPATARAVEDEVVKRWMPRCRVFGGAKAGSGEMLGRLMTGGGGGGGEEAYTDDSAEDEDEEEEDDDAVNGSNSSIGSDDDGHDHKNIDDQEKNPPEIISEQTTRINPIAIAIAKEKQGSKGRKKRRPILFLTGQTRNDLLPKLLQDHGIQVDEMIVYASAELDEFSHTLAQTLTKTEAPPSTITEEEFITTTTTKSNSNSKSIRILTFFSPLATRTTLQTLNWLDNSNNNDKIKPELNLSPPSKHNHPTKSNPQRNRSVYIAAIGPTTQSHLRSEFGFEADIVALRPSPEGLRDGIVEFMRNEYKYES